MSSKIDYIYNGAAHGDVADRLLASGMDVDALRPWKDKHGRGLVAFRDPVTGKRKTVFSNAATIMKQQWVEMDNVVVRVARPPLRVWGDIVAAGATYNIPNGMSKTVIQHQTATDTGTASLDMDALSDVDNDRPTTGLENLPLPIVHSGFHVTLREMMISDGTELALDVSGLENATRRCVELVEKLTIGSLASYSYGGGTLYGVGNYPYRMTASLTLPTAAGWTPDVLVDEINGMVQQAQDVYFNGPYAVWYSPAWSKYFNSDYSATYAGDTLLSRLRKIEDVSTWRKAYFLSGFRVILCQLTSDVVQAVTGMKLRTIQWDSKGGLRKNYKVLGIMVPRVRRNANDDTGIVDGVAA